MTKPFEHVLGLIPKGVLAGLFVSCLQLNRVQLTLVQWYMGSDALLSSGVTEKMLYLVREKRATSPSEPLNQVRKSRVITFTLVELIGFGATFAITQVSSFARSLQRTLNRRPDHCGDWLPNHHHAPDPPSSLRCSPSRVHRTRVGDIRWSRCQSICETVSTLEVVY